jgi:hypothetical protein
MISNLKRTIEPKVYALLLKSPETIFLSIQYTYSLEEAFVLAKLEFEKQNPARTGWLNPLMGAEIGLFTIKTVRELTSTLRPPQNDTVMRKPEAPAPAAVNPTQEPPEVQKIKLLLTQKEKNSLMKEIIDTKDLDKFQKNKQIFSDVEIKYIKGKLK